MKLSFQNDSNSLNRGFYTELLHIIGIEERKENNKTVIVRKAVERRDEASLLENTINQLDAEDCLRHVMVVCMETIMRSGYSMSQWNCASLG